LFAVCWAALVLVVTLVAGAAWQIDQRYQLGLLPASEGFGVFVLRQTALSAIVAVLLLRYFWARQEWREKVRTDAESRLQALTARIRPHFLFNALNSVAALVSLRPEQAEQMVEDLGEVFRACLDQPKASLPLREEIDICKAYLRIEQSRLGDKLKVEWRIPPELMDWQIPRFVLQPLVENAVYHGVSRIKEGGDVLVTGELIEDRLHLQVSNPLPSTDVPRTEGHRIAANNIASRLAMMYGTRGRLEMGIVANRYTSRLLLPREPAARHGGKRK
jgi:two-component system sensor histidine kinase AlgZ